MQWESGASREASPISQSFQNIHVGESSASPSVWLGAFQDFRSADDLIFSQYAVAVQSISL